MKKETKQDKKVMLSIYVLNEFTSLEKSGMTEYPDQLDYLFKNPPISFLKENEISMLKYREVCNKVAREIYKLNKWNKESLQSQTQNSIN